ncbi:hypothetical protein ACSNOI_26205 [Actinomadura kijaniata]|uniref:hypothetical protein n=1 Tax=Actinomadura kijaniata TaxID=46161 RepID=UPI003F1A95B1
MAPPGFPMYSSGDPDAEAGDPAFAPAEGVILLGLPLAMVSRSEAVFAAGFLLGYPLPLWLALPTARTVETIRRLEAGGAGSRLWAALLSPGPRRARR